MDDEHNEDIFLSIHKGHQLASSKHELWRKDMIQELGRGNFKNGYSMEWHELPLAQPDIDIALPEETRAQEQRELDTATLQAHIDKYEEKFKDVIFDITKSAGLVVAKEFLDRRQAIAKAEGAGASGGSAVAGDQA